MKLSLKVGSLALVAALAGTVALAGCSFLPTSVKGDASVPVVTVPVVTQSATPTPSDPLGIPAMPAPLPLISDPGTIDPILGTFPASDPRRYQFSWLNYAKDGRAMATVGKQADASGFLANLPDADLYYMGVSVCTDVATNLTVESILDWLVQYGTDDANATSSDYTFDETLFAAAVSKLCPAFKPVLNDIDYLTPTPDMIRGFLGVDNRSLTDDAANRFANWVCTSLKNGETQSRITNAVATKYGYPDDVSEKLVARIKTVVC